MEYFAFLFSLRKRFNDGGINDFQASWLVVISGIFKAKPGISK
jgi:hypothetical protein